MNRVIIVEGLDRCGKDTIIKHIEKKVGSSIVIHCVAPQGRTNEEKLRWQKMKFEHDLKMVNTTQLKNMTVIFNRSYIGEAVYGPIYRGTDSDWIYELEEKYVDLENSCLILLTADPKFIVKNDDGLSFTTDVKKKQVEIDKFKEAFERSKIQNKLHLVVNEGDEYIDQEKEFKIVDEFLKL